MKRIVLLLGVCFSIFCGRNSSSLCAQDPLFSQFFNNRNYTNPAFTGIDGGISIRGTYRNQWFKIPGRFESSYLSVEAASPCLNSAFGLHLLHDEEGEGALNTLTAGFDYVFVLKMAQSTSDIRFGLSTYWFRKWIDWDALIFSDQLDAKQGVLGNSVSAAQRLYDVEPSALGFKGGFVHRFDIAKKGSDDFSVSWGAGVSHLGSIRLDEAPRDGFYLNDPLAWRLSVFAGAILPFTRYIGAGYVITVIPQLRYEQQANIKVTTLGATWHYNAFSLGLFYQNTFPWGSNTNTDAMIGYFGYTQILSKRHNLELGVSYDTNNGPRMGESNLGGLTGGVIELTARLHFKGASFMCKGGKKGKKYRGGCPSLSGSHRRKYERSFHKSPGNKNLN